MARSVKQVLLTGGLALGLVVAAAAPAGAAVSFSLNTGSTSGGGLASGTMTFKSKTSFYVSVDVRDVCPGDGEGVYLRALIEYTDGLYITKPVAADTNGCGTTPVSIGTTISTSKNIRSVALYLEEKDASGVDVDGVLNESDATLSKDNPYT